MGVEGAGAHDLRALDLEEFILDPPIPSQVLALASECQVDISNSFSTFSNVTICTRSASPTRASRAIQAHMVLPRLEFPFGPPPDPCPCSDGPNFYNLINLGILIDCIIACKTLRGSPRWPWLRRSQGTRAPHAFSTSLPRKRSAPDFVHNASM